MSRYDDDDELADGLQRGDPDAAVAMVRRFRRRLIAFAMGKKFSYEDAEDLAQEALATGWQRIASFRKGTLMVRWLAGIEVNLMRRQWEKASAAPVEFLDELAAGSGDIRAQVSAVDPVEAKRLATLWAKAELYFVLLKDNRYVQAVRLRHIDGLSDAEVAEVLGLGGPASAREYVRRGLKELKKMDQTEAPEEPPRPAG